MNIIVTIRIIRGANMHGSRDKPPTLNREVPGWNVLAAAVVPSDKALYIHCLVPRKGIKAVGPLIPW